MKILTFLFVILCFSAIPIILRRVLNEKTGVNLRIEKLLMWLNLLFTTILISSIIMSFQEVYWRGYKSTTYILILTIFSGSIYYIIASNSLIGIMKKAYSILLTLGMFISIIICLESFNRFEEKNYYSNSNYRLENTFNGIIAPYQLPKLFVKNGLIENRYDLNFKENEWEIFFKSDIDSVDINRRKNNYEVIFYLKENLVIETYSDNFYKP